MKLETRAGETVLLLGFIGLAAVLWFVVVPAGIPTSRMSAGAAVTPRSLPYAVALSIAVLCLVRLAALWLLPQPELEDPQVPAGSGAGETRHPFRLAAIVVLCLFYGHTLIPLAGFYLSSILLLAVVAVLLGERHWPTLLLVPTGLAAAVFLLFERGFMIRLPKGAIASLWPVF